MHASAILQDYLDEVGRTVMADDWDAYRLCVDLPCQIISAHESKVVSTVEDLKIGFEEFRNTLRTQRVTDYVRLVETAVQMDRELISGRYVSHLIAGSHRLIHPFRSEITLRLIGNIWRAVSVTNTLANSRWPLMRLTNPLEKTSEGSSE